MPEPQPNALPRPRWIALDAARGAAVLAMALYHGAWDLSALRLIETDILAEPAWRWFARSIAGSFLILVGIGLVLAHGDGVRVRPFLRRLALIAGAALAVSVATWFVFPDAWIFFGILHCIALSSVLALPFLRMPWPGAALAAAACFLAPWFLTSPIFDRPALDWLGLGQADPVTNDYVPVFPWFGAVLTGVLVGKAVRRFHPPRRQVDGRAFRSLAFLGRHSLAIYLLHQPVLFGAFSALVALTGPNPRAEAAAFARQCSSACMPVRGDEALCRAACACVEGRLKREGLWRPVVTNRIAPEDRPRITALAGQCFANPDSTPP